MPERDGAKRDVPSLIPKEDYVVLEHPVAPQDYKNTQPSITRSQKCLNNWFFLQNIRMEIVTLCT